MKRLHIEFASTCGHRLSVMSFDQETEMSDVQTEATVPAKALQDLVRILERSPDADVSVSYDQSQIIFKLADYQLTSRLLEGQYPNYRQLVPRQFALRITAERKLLLSALERVAILAEQKQNIVILTIDVAEQLLTLSVDAADVGSGKETILANITGDDLEIAFNVKYFMDGLKAIATTEVQMQFNTVTSPAIVRPLGGDDLTYLMMPISLRS